MVFRNHEDRYFEIFELDARITIVDQISFLKITIDKNQFWKAHTENLATNMSKYCFEEYHRS